MIHSILQAIFHLVLLQENLKRRTEKYSCAQSKNVKLAPKRKRPLSTRNNTMWEWTFVWVRYRLYDCTTISIHAPAEGAFKQVGVVIGNRRCDGLLKSRQEYFVKLFYDTGPTFPITFNRPKLCYRGVCRRPVSGCPSLTSLYYNIKMAKRTIKKQCRRIAQGFQFYYAKVQRYRHVTRNIACSLCDS